MTGQMTSPCRGSIWHRTPVSSVRRGAFLNFREPVLDNLQSRDLTVGLRVSHDDEARSRSGRRHYRACQLAGAPFELTTAPHRTAMQYNESQMESVEWKTK